MIDDASNAIGEEHEPQLRDLSILFYLRNIEGMEVASFGMLRLASPHLGNADIDQLLTESFDEASDDAALLEAIIAYYLRK